MLVDLIEVSCPLLINILNNLHTDIYHNIFFDTLAIVLQIHNAVYINLFWYTSSLHLFPATAWQMKTPHPVLLAQVETFVLKSPLPLSPNKTKTRNKKLKARRNQQVQGQVWMVKDALEARYGVIFHGNHVSMPWLVTHASGSLTRYHVSEDGRKGYQNWKGKKFSK